MLGVDLGQEGGALNMVTVRLLEPETGGRKSSTNVARRLA